MLRITPNHRLCFLICASVDGDDDLAVEDSAVEDTGTEVSDTFYIKTEDGFIPWVPGAMEH